MIVRAIKYYFTVINTKEGFLMKKTISILICALMVFSFNLDAYASSSVPTSMDQTEIDRLGQMTLQELEKIAKPMPENALSYYDDPITGDKAIRLGNPKSIPKEGIFYFENKGLSNKSYKNFYKFLYVTRTVTDTPNMITYHIYTWDFTNGSLSNSGELIGDQYYPELYKELFSNPTDNKDDDKEYPSNPEEDNDDSTDSGSSDTTGSIYYKKRISGANRIDTSKYIAEEFSDNTVDSVILATAYNYPDSLTGSVLATKLNAPILLVGSANDNKPIFDYIKEHLSSNGTIYVLGGKDAVNESTINTLKALGYTNIKRLSGGNRYDTSKEISKELNVDMGTPIVIATGNDFSDALSISSIAAAKGYPILLTEKDTLTSQTKEMINKIKPEKIYIAGGTKVITDKIKNNIKSVSGLDDSNYNWDFI